MQINNEPSRFTHSGMFGAVTEVSKETLADSSCDFLFKLLTSASSVYIYQHKLALSLLSSNQNMQLHIHMVQLINPGLIDSKNLLC